MLSASMVSLLSQLLCLQIVHPHPGPGQGAWGGRWQRIRERKEILASLVPTFRNVPFTNPAAVL